MKNLIRITWSFMLLGLALSCLTGCGGTNAQSMLADAADSNAKRLGSLYFRFQKSNRDVKLLGPSNREEFEEFIRSQSQDRLSLIGVNKDNLDELFVSGRDNQPFEIRWEVQGISRGPAQPVIFESEGVDGKYVVGFTGFVEKEVDKVEYDRLKSGVADAG